MSLRDFAGRVVLVNFIIDQWSRVRKRTAPTMLVQIGRPAIEWLIKAGATD